MVDPITVGTDVSVYSTPLPVPLLVTSYDNGQATKSTPSMLIATVLKSSNLNSSSLSLSTNASMATFPSAPSLATRAN